MPSVPTERFRVTDADQLLAGLLVAKKAGPAGMLGDCRRRTVRFSFDTTPENAAMIRLLHNALSAAVGRRVSLPYAITRATEEFIPELTRMMSDPKARHAEATRHANRPRLWVSKPGPRPKHAA